MKIICPLFYSDEASFWSELDQVQDQGFDWLEIRLDKYINEQGTSQVESILFTLKKRVSLPVLITIRTQNEGGMAKLTLEEYEKLEEQIAQKGFYQDIEFAYFKSSTILQKLDLNKIILSYHNFNKTPSLESLCNLWTSMEQYKPFISKISCMPQSQEDVSKLMESSMQVEKKGKRIAISMSCLGKQSRLYPEKFLSDFTFCIGSTASAPGQLTVEKFHQLRSINQPKN